jgi:hypothetical protein
MGSKTNNQKIKYKGRMTVENLIILKKGQDSEGCDSDFKMQKAMTATSRCRRL